MKAQIKVRATYHNGRVGKHGVYSAKHNDRNYDTENARNIDAALSSKNEYFIITPSGEIIANPTITFEQHERNFYREMFGDALEAQNAKYRKKGNYDRIKSIDDLRTSPRTCPEESIFQLGARDDEIDPAALHCAVASWIGEMRKRYGSNWRVISIASHMDEPNGQKHIHVRAVYVYEKSPGEYAVSQNKALEALGVERPDMTAPKSQYNNPKQVFTKSARDIFVSCARAHGVDIIDAPAEPKKKTLALEDYLVQQRQKEVQQLTEQRDALQQETAQMTVERDQLRHEVITLQDEKTRLQRLTERLKSSCMRLFEKLTRLICTDGRCALEHAKCEAQDVLDACNDVDRDDDMYLS